MVLDVRFRDMIDNRQQSCRLPSVINGLSHGLKIAQRFAIFTPVCALVPPFQVLGPTEKSNTEWGWTFLAGALGLEPRAYGFGDRRSTN